MPEGLWAPDDALQRSIEKVAMYEGSCVHAQREKQPSSLSQPEIFNFRM
jgi:hypothetical protein